VKKCNKCLEPKTLDQFGKDKSTKNGLRRWCKVCTNANGKLRRKTNPTKWRWNRRAHLWKKFGITPEQYDKMLKTQNGVCAICHRPETNHLRGILRCLSVDHDHTTGVIRGLLCAKCNQGIGSFGDDPVRLIAASTYLNRGTKVV